jgi:GAF domain-containing protein
MNVQQMCEASVSLAREGGYRTASATSDVVRFLDGVQYEADRGPCVDAIRTGRCQRASGRDALRHRWPAFGAAAVERGIGATLSTPLEARGRALGALNLYARADDAFGDASSTAAVIFARHAGAVVANAAAYADSEATKANLLEALATRQVIGQAMGIIMAREHCGSEDAFDVLRKVSQRTNVKLRDIAAEILRVTETNASR